MEKYADKLSKDRMVDVIETNRDELIVEEIRDALEAWYEESPTAKDKAHELLTTHEASDFVNWFINGRYITNIEDVKKLFYISENKSELIDMVVKSLTMDETEVIADELLDENENAGLDENRPEFNKAMKLLKDLDPGAQNDVSGN